MASTWSSKSAMLFGLGTLFYHPAVVPSHVFYSRYTVQHDPCKSRRHKTRPEITLQGSGTFYEALKQTVPSSARLSMPVPIHRTPGHKSLHQEGRCMRLMADDPPQIVKLQDSASWFASMHHPAWLQQMQAGQSLRAPAAFVDACPEYGQIWLPNCSARDKGFNTAHQCCRPCTCTHTCCLPMLT